MGNTIDRCVWHEIRPGTTNRPPTSMTLDWPGGSVAEMAAMAPSTISTLRSTRARPSSTSTTVALANQLV